MPRTFETMCITWEYRSITMSSETCTLPISLTRPTSFRPRSTSMMCSARSLGSARSSFSSALSSSSVAPRRRVPAMGRRSILPFLEAHHHLGRSADHGRVAAAQEIHVGRRVDEPERPVDLEGLRRDLPLEPLGRHDLEDVAGLDVLLGLEDRLFVLRLGEVGLELLPSVLSFS